MKEFEIRRAITCELYDRRSYYQIIVSITKCEILWNYRLKIVAHTLLINT